MCGILNNWRKGPLFLDECDRTRMAAIRCSRNLKLATRPNSGPAGLDSLENVGALANLALAGGEVMRKTSQFLMGFVFLSLAGMFLVVLPSRAQDPDLSV